MAQAVELTREQMLVVAIVLTDLAHLFAGQGHSLVESLPAGELVRRLADDARTALNHATVPGS